jgi:hypothetical protein
MSPPDRLPAIPLIEVSAAAEPAVASALAEPARLALLMDSAQRTYTKLGVRVADARSRAWGARSSSPYAGAVAAVDRAIVRPGAFLLNYSYEWGCTTGAGDDPENGATLYRTLDWPFAGLGRAVVVLRMQAKAGPYLSVTWPGYAGVLTGLAPGRFAAAINQPPLPLPGLGKAAGWVAARARTNRSTALPPSHLLRLAFETCRSFEEAAALIRRTPLCLSAIFTLAGPKAGEAIVIERTGASAFEPARPVAANHWAAEQAPPGRPRNRSSLARRSAMAKVIEGQQNCSLDWLKPPILQPDTRLAVTAHPRSGRLLVQGWEKTGAATSVMQLDG